MMLTALPLLGVPRVSPGDDLAGLLVRAATSPGGPGLLDGDVLVVTSKVVSKAEGRIVRGLDRDEVIDAETRRVVSSWESPNGRTVIAETMHGLVLAAAGVDASNTEPGTLVLLPLDPDGSANALRTEVLQRTGANVAVVISDSMGRPWRRGQTDVAIGAAGLRVLDDLRGTRDAYGHALEVTIRAVGDEVAGAAELVASKTTGVPALIVRGLADLVLPPKDPGTGAAGLIMPAEDDRFRLGTPEAMRGAVLARRTVRDFLGERVPRRVFLDAIRAAVAAPAPHHTRPWRFVLVESVHVRRRLVEAMTDAWIADLRRDGLSDGQIGERVGRGTVLKSAPHLIVPCMVADGMHPYPDVRRSEAERTMFILSAGAGIQNLLVSLSAEGVGSAWLSASLFCADVVRRVLELPEDWRPMGCVAAGTPAAPAREREHTDPRDMMLVR